MSSDDRILKKTDRPIWFLCAAVFITVFLLSVLTPKYADDFCYTFSFATDRRIQSVADIFPSMATHRVLLNGRVVPHFFVQLFLMFPKAVFSLLNALQAVLLMLLSSRYLQSEGRTKCLVLLCGLFGIWIFSPSFGENYLWLDGAVNYSWALTALMLFLIPYGAAWLEIPAKKNPVLSILHILVAFAAGAWSENGALAFLFLAMILSLGIWIRDRKPPVRLLLGICSATAGYIFLMTAPATAGRSAPFEMATLVRNAQAVLEAAVSRLLILYITFAVLLALAVAYGGRKKRIVFAVLLFLAGFGALCSFVFAAYFVERHFSCTIFLTVLSCSVLLDELVQQKKLPILYALTAALAVVFVFRFSLGAIDILVSNQKEAERERQIGEALSRGEKTVTLTNYFPNTGYALPFILDAPDDWVNVAVSSYYGLDTVYGVNPD